MTGSPSRKPGWFGHVISVPVVVIGLCLAAVRVLADPPVTAVLYPDIREPFRDVFLTIAKGVEDVGITIKPRAITDEDTTESIKAWLSENRIQAVVALGSRGQSLSDELPRTMPVVIGAVHMSPLLRGKQYYGVTLSPNPAFLLQRLKNLAPGVNRVTLIYHKDRDRWMVDQALAPAQKLGVTLNAIPVERLQEAVVRYQQVLPTLKSDSDALWLSQDSAVLDEQAVLPMILREAWDRRLIVFSSNPSHVRRGILFAMYPNNERMGRILGAMAIRARDRLDHGSPASAQGMLLLDELDTAFNTRTAGRLGVRFSKESLSEYDLVFPTM